jgi:hypothetical protein
VAIVQSEVTTIRDEEDAKKWFECFKNHGAIDIWWEIDDSKCPPQKFVFTYDGNNVTRQKIIDKVEAEMTRDADTQIQLSKIERWEYLTIANITNDELNEYGNVGWEAYAVTEDEDNTCFFFKRRRHG